jgi:hypothetical protein
MSGVETRRRTILNSNWAIAAVVFVGLAVVHTWPLATRPGVRSRNDKTAVRS